MNLTRCFPVAVLALALSLSAAFAEAPDTIEVPHQEDFFVTHISQMENERFMLTGSTGNRMDSSGMVLCVDMNGAVVWSLQEEDEYFSESYRTAEWLGNGKALALRAAGRSNSDAWIIDFVERGRILRHTKPMKTVLGVYPVSEGFLTDSQPEFYKPRITRFNESGKALWHIDWGNGSPSTAS